MNISSLITGIILLVIGLVLIITSFFIKPFFVPLIYGIPLLIIGIFILFNEKEDKIEKIKKSKRR